MSITLSTRLVCLIAAVLAALAGLVVSSRLTDALTTVTRLETEDPLFDFPGLSPAEWPESVSILRDADRTVAKELPEPMRPGQFYPLEFWEASWRVAEARSSFLAGPTRRNAWRLLQAEEGARDAYFENLERFSDFFELAVAENEKLLAANPLFVFFPGTATDVATLAAALDGFRENASAIQRELSLRKHCLFLGSCRELRSRKANTGSPSGEAGASSIASQRILPRQTISGAFSALHGVLLDDRLFFAPTGCFGDPGGRTPFLLGVLPTGNERMTFFPKLATNSLFRPIRSANRYPQDELPHRAGYAYAWQPETSWYLCPDLGYYPILATMYELVQRNASRPLADALSLYLPSSLADELREREEDMREAVEIGIEMIAGYVGALRRAEEHLKGLGWSALASELRERIRIWETKSGGLISVLRGLTLDAQTFAHTAEVSHGEDLPPSLVVAIARSHLSLLLAPWNPSVWRLDEAPRFLFADTQPRRHLVDYWTLREELGESAIQEIQRLTAAGLPARSR